MYSNIKHSQTFLAVILTAHNADGTQTIAQSPSFKTTLGPLAIDHNFQFILEWTLTL